MTNEGKIIIGVTILTGSSGILNSGTLINTATGTIQIDHSRGRGLVNVKTVTNGGLIRIGATVPPLVGGILNIRTNPSNPLPVFTNLACGVIEVFSQVVNQNGTFTNNSLLTVNTSRSYFKTVVRVNSPGSIAKAYDFTAAGFGGSIVGLNLTADAVFVEDGTAPATDGWAALTNAAQLAGKIALIDRGTCQFGFKCLQAQQAGAIAVIVFNNVGGTVIMAPGDVGNQVTIPCVSLTQADGNAIRMALATSAVNISFNQETESTDPLTNNGVIDYPQGNPIPNVTNNDLVVAPITLCGTVFAPALQIGGINSFTAGSTWYKDPTLTQPGGTYNQASNTFTATNLTPGTTTTLYFTVTDNVNGCPRTGSVAVTLNAASNSFNSTPTVSQVPACAGGSIKVSFTIGSSGVCGVTEGNAFTVEISDASGVFADPARSLGVVNPGINPVSLPQDLPTGSGYRMRIRASNPAQLSSLSAAFTINQSSFASTPSVSLDNKCAGEAVRLSFSVGCAFFSGNTFSAQLSSASGVFAASPVSLGTVSPGALNNVVIPAGTPAGTGYKIRIVSSNPVLTSAVSANFRVKACANREVAPEEAGLRVVVSPNPSPEGRLRISVSGAEGQALRVALFNGTGQGVREQAIERAGEEETLTWDISRQPQGLYLLRVSGGREARTVKILH